MNPRGWRPYAVLAVVALLYVFATVLATYPPRVLGCRSRPGARRSDVERLGDGVGTTSAHDGPAELVRRQRLLSRTRARWRSRSTCSSRLFWRHRSAPRRATPCSATTWSCFCRSSSRHSECLCSAGRSRVTPSPGSTGAFSTLSTRGTSTSSFVFRSSRINGSRSCSSRSYAISRPDVSRGQCPRPFSTAFRA